MANAFKDPLFQDQLRDAQDKEGCLICHAPMKGMVSRWEEEGIGCDFCHSLNSVTVRADHTSVVMDEGIMTRFWPSLPHGKDYPVIKGSEACTPCHHFGKGGTMIEDTYKTWKESPYSRRKIRCQDCHMPIMKGLRRHDFPGGHSEEMLKKAVDLKALLLKVGQGYLLKVIVTNSRTGHSLPGGTMGRQLWLEVKGYSGMDMVFKDRRLYGKLFDSDGRLIDTTLRPLEGRVERFLLPLVERIKISLRYLLAPSEVQKEYGWDLPAATVKEVELLP